jgi:predicted amidohydrolase
MQDLKVSFIQSNLIWKDSSANLSAFENKIAQIEEDTDLIVLPEMFNTGFVVEPETIDSNLADKALEWMKRMSSEKNAAVCGSVIVKEKTHFYNRFYWVEPNGGVQQYDKRHLFSLGGEDKHFSSGQDLLIIEYKAWKIKPLICYDLRFPVWAKNTFENEEYAYDLLIYVANWPAARSHAWRSLLVARAIENQAYVLGVNRIGNDGRGTPHSGFSGVIEPKGEWISEEVENKESVQTIKLSGEELQKYRSKFTVALDWDEFKIEI